MKLNFLGDKNFFKHVFSVMLPILIQNVITNFVSLLDNIMVGQIGTEEMVGVAIVNQLIFIFNLCIFGGLSGAGIFTAQYHGNNDPDGVRYSFRIKLFIAIGSFVVFSALFIFFGDNLITAFLYEGEDSIDIEKALIFAKEYMSVMLWQLFPFAIANLYATTLRETGKTVPPMAASVSAVVINLVLNYILIFGKLGFPVMSIKGAALATVISRFAEMLIVIIWTHKNSKSCKFIVSAYKSLKVPKILVFQVCKMGLPLLANEVLWASGMTMLNRYYSVRGVEVVGAINISSTASNLFFCAFLAMGTTVSIIIGQLLGAGEKERAVDETNKLIIFSIILCAGVGVIMAILSPYIPNLYNATDLVKSIAVKMLLISAAMMPVNAFINVCYFTLRSGGKTLITFIFDSAFVWVVSIPAALCIALFTDIPIIPMYIIVQALDFIKCILGYVLIKKKVWVNNLVRKN